MGFFSCFLTPINGDLDFAKATERLGGRWYLPETAYKPYPCCQLIHAFIEAAKQLLVDLEREGVSPDMIERTLVPANRPPGLREVEVEVLLPLAAECLARLKQWVDDVLDELAAELERVWTEVEGPLLARRTDPRAIVIDPDQGRRIHRASSEYRAMYYKAHNALEAIRKTTSLALPPGHTREEMRTEAIASLCLPDFEVLQSWEGWTEGTAHLAFDSTLTTYVRSQPSGEVSIRRVADAGQTPGGRTCGVHPALDRRGRPGHLTLTRVRIAAFAQIRRPARVVRPGQRARRHLRSSTQGRAEHEGPNGSGTHGQDL